MQTVVSIIGARTMYDEDAWQCTTEAEATNMVKWLKSQNVPARATSLMIWQALSNKWKAAEGLPHD